MPRWETYSVEVELKTTIRDDNGKIIGQTITNASAKAGSNPDAGDRTLPDAFDAAAETVKNSSGNLVLSFATHREYQRLHPVAGVVI